MLRLYYVANVRMPTEKAHGIQIAKMAEAFIEQGIGMTLIVPSRHAEARSLQDFYDLRVDVPLVRLPAPDWYRRGRWGYIFSSLFFMLATAWFLMMRRAHGERFVIYTADMDEFSNTFLPLLGATVTEVHSAKRSTRAHRFLFRRARGIIATSIPIADSLMKTFSLSASRIFVEPNGVDERMFKKVVSKEDARKKLGLSQNVTIALYVGRFYEWKGLGILNEAATLLAAQGIMLSVLGGTREEFEKVFGSAAPELHFFGAAAPADVPEWLAAADVLLVLGTRSTDSSYRYTSPMKVYEYAAMCRPIVASATPALASMLAPDEAFFYESDNAESLASTVKKALSSSHASNEYVERASIKALYYTWNKRAKRIIDFVERTTVHII